MYEQIIALSLVALVLLPLLLLQIIRAPKPVRIFCIVVSLLYFFVGGIIFFETKFALVAAFGGATIAALGFSLYKKLVVRALTEQLSMVPEVVSFAVSEFRNLTASGRDEIFVENLRAALNRGDLSKQEQKIVRHMIKFHSDIGHDCGDGKEIAAYPAMVPACTYSISFPDLATYEERLKESCKSWGVSR